MSANSSTALSSRAVGPRDRGTYRDPRYVAHLVDGAHTWDCPNGHRNVTWESPAPVVGAMKKCSECWPPDPGTVRVVAVAAGLPLAKVRDILGAKDAAAVLAAGGAA